MMQITLTADYALRAIEYLAGAGSGRCVPAAEIAREQEIPLVYVSKVLQALVQAGIAATVPGRSGGARLLRTASRISVLDVVEAVDGPIPLNRCLIRDGECSRDRFCKFHPFWKKTRDSLKKELQRAKLSQFVAPPAGRAPRNWRTQ